VSRMAVSRNGMISQVSNASQEIDSIIKELRDWRDAGAAAAERMAG
jgi:hypothetical protein